MLFESLLQPKIFLIVFCIGFCSGFVFDLAGYIVFLCKHNKVVKFIFDYLATVITFAIFFLTILLVNYGEFRVYHFIAFYGALLLERFTLGKLVKKLINFVYTQFLKLIQKLFQKKKNKVTEQ